MNPILQLSKYAIDKARVILLIRDRHVEWKLLINYILNNILNIITLVFFVTQRQMPYCRKQVGIQKWKIKIIVVTTKYLHAQVKIVKYLIINGPHHSHVRNVYAIIFKIGTA